MASNRLQRIALMLTGYDFDIAYVKSNSYVADYFSRYPQPYREDTEDLFKNVYLNYSVSQDKGIDAKTIKTETFKDDVLLRVSKFIIEGWPEKCTDVDLKPFFARKNELSEQSGCFGCSMKCLFQNREKIMNTSPRRIGLLASALSSLKRWKN